MNVTNQNQSLVKNELGHGTLIKSKITILFMSLLLSILKIIFTVISGSLETFVHIAKEYNL